MADELKLNRPYLLAAWPGMGHVAMTAAYYLLSKLDMHGVAELDIEHLFDIEHVEVKDGLIQHARLPRNRIFVPNTTGGEHDIVVFIGEAQPAIGKYQLCQALVGHAKELGVERIFTFAAMATDMHPGHASRVFGATTDDAGLAALQPLDVELLEEGRISGLNGALLGVAAEEEMSGTCLLGEMPHVFAQLPYPKASLAVLQVFKSLAGIEFDLEELTDQARMVDQQIGQLLGRVEQAMAKESEESEEEYAPEPEPEIDTEDARRIDALFQQAARDRSKAYELKRELDRLNLFAEFEDRFLDLFKKPDLPETSE